MTQFVKLKYFYTNINVQTNHLYEPQSNTKTKLQITFEPTLTNHELRPNLRFGGGISAI